MSPFFCAYECGFMVFLGNWEVYNLVDIAYFAHNRARTRDLPLTYTFI